jgi:hypothetical protein
METLWFCLVALMIAMYVVFDGFDLGAGIVQGWVAHARRSAAPCPHDRSGWDGNEVWLIAGGGTLLRVPRAPRASFSGFYLPLMMVLWLLGPRGCSIGVPDHIKNDACVRSGTSLFQLRAASSPSSSGPRSGTWSAASRSTRTGVLRTLWVVGSADRAGSSIPTR